jgi:molybdopterin-guanine dinucleotide biosynthesis protein A
MKSGAVVLCGGESRRMGRSKAWLPFGPELLLQRIVRLVGQTVETVVIVAAPGQDLPPLPFGVTIVRDAVSGRGPLQGLASGLAALPTTVDLAYATATDVPFLQPAWITLLRELIGDSDLAVPFEAGHHHPLAALYRRATVLPVVASLASHDRVGPIFLVEAMRSRTVTAAELRAVDPDLQTLRNINTPEEYRNALRDAGFGA